MTDNDGKLTDVLIEDSITTDPKTGIEYFSNLNIWADKGNREIIESVPGVSNVFQNTSATNYAVFLDHRYDREWVKAEIEARIKIGSE